MHPNHTTNEVPYGFCQCGCGQKTNLAVSSNARLGRTKGEPYKYIAGHNPSKKTKRASWQTNPLRPPWVAKYGLRYAYGLCQCGCGEDAPLAKITDNIKRLTIQGLPQRFIRGHTYLGTAEMRFWESVTKRAPNECWEWQGSTYGQGYGRFKHNYKTYRSHQFSYRLHIGPIPKGLFVCHKCDNPCCVNPNHLYLGTAQDNTDDMIAKGRNRTTPGESNSHAKLTAVQVTDIRSMVQQGKSFIEIARQFHVSPSTISMIANRKTWTCVP